MYRSRSSLHLHRKPASDPRFLEKSGLTLSYVHVELQAVLSTIITLKLQKVETLKTIRIKYAIITLLMLFLLGSAIA